MACDTRGSSSFAAAVDSGVGAGFSRRGRTEFGFLKRRPGAVAAG
jgi:hypothetical protein